MSRRESGCRKASQGTALIMAMIVVMLATGAAVAMASRRQLDLRRLENTELYDEALLQVGGIELWGRGVIGGLGGKSRLVTAAMVDREAFNAKLDNGRLSARLVDLSGRFNLNNLIRDGKVSTLDLQRFERLLTLLNIDPGIAAAVLDWEDPDASPRPGGAEDDYYSRLDPPYRAANQPFADVRELRRVRGVTDAVYQRLEAVVTALPGYTDININTAPAPVIESLADNVGVQLADAIVDRQARGGFETLGALLGMFPKGGASLSTGGLALRGSYFEVRGRIEIGRVRMAVSSVLAVTTGGSARLMRRRLSEVTDG
jgi:general secretion pathway protein K